MKRHQVVLVFILLALALTACKSKVPEVVVIPPPMPEEAGPSWWNDRIFYEVFVRSFQDSDGDGTGDLQGLIDRLDYLNDGDPEGGDDLGVTGLWLMPVAESPSYHGYDVVDYKTVEQDYGNNETFKLLMEEAHKRGIVVIVDLVINHTSNQHAWFQDAARGPDAQHRDWYVWSNEPQSYLGPWGQSVWYKRGGAYYYAIFWQGMPDLNYRTQAVTDEMYSATRFWLEEMGVDGFRMDAIRHLIEDGQQQENTTETHQWLQAYHRFYKSLSPQAITVGEVWTRSEDVVPYVGNEMDICFEFDLASAILDGVRGGGAFTLASVVQKTAKLYPPNQYATFLTNHDQNRAMSQLGNDPAKAKAAASIYLTLPGVPFLYYGEEIGLTGEKPDENLRTPMHWAGDAGAGFTTGTAWQRINTDYQDKNVANQLGDADSLLNHYRALIRLRSAFAALRSGEIANVSSEARSVIAYLRHSETEAILVVHNLGNVAVDEYALSIRASPIAPGTYAAYELLAEREGADLAVGETGAFADYEPLPALEPLQSVVIFLSRQ
ncbi:MAG: alpha-amylase [Anaerolineae bacterium]|nr:alpha-amylase [Anaerolineae bacterium]